MAARMIDSVDIGPAPLRMTVGSLALQHTISVLRESVADFETQTELAACTDFSPGA
jgi:hypothetical protein